MKEKETSNSASQVEELFISGTFVCEGNDMNSSV